MNFTSAFFNIIFVNNTFFVLNDAMLHLSRGPVAVYSAGAQLAPATVLFPLTVVTNKLLPQAYSVIYCCFVSCILTPRVYITSIVLTLDRMINLSCKLSLVSYV